MGILRMYQKYFKYLVQHKLFVGQECFKRGLHWRGIVHDASKFLPSELIPYANFFGRPDPNAGHKASFRYAWLKHCNRNSHHWQFYCIARDGEGGPTVLEMPEKDRVEMLCDWIGASKAQGLNGGSDLAAWYKEREKYILLGPKTKAYIKKELGI